MTDEQKNKIRNYRVGGLGYGKIAELLDLSVNTVKSYCRRNDLAGNKSELKADVHLCQYCGEIVLQDPKRKEKKFCSDKCRMKWWNDNPDKVNRKANYELVCERCKKPFTSYGNQTRKYCSHKCYILNRFGGEASERRKRNAVLCNYGNC